MKIFVRQCYLESGHDYAFSFMFADWLVQELAKRVRVSKSFDELYSKDFSVGVSIDASSKISEPEVDGPKVFRRDKEVIIYVTLPHSGGSGASTPKRYAKAFKQLLDGIATGFHRLGLNATGIVDDSPALIQHFASCPEMIEHDWDEAEIEPRPQKRTGAKAGPSEISQPPKGQPTAPRLTNKKLNRTRATASPKWRVPENIAKRVEKDGGVWEDERFDPILLTVMSGVSYQGRDIPLIWQIEFDPSDVRLEAANAKLKATGIDTDGDGWADVVKNEFARRHPKFKNQFHSDSESSGCVIWVESPAACRKLIELVWSLTQQPSAPEHVAPRSKKASPI